MRAFAFLTASILIFLSSAEAFAEEPLQDQAVAMTPGPSGWAISDRNAQTVTSGITGTLVQVDVQIFQSNEFAEGDLWVDIFGTLPNGLPDIPTDGVPLASSLIRNEDIPTTEAFGSEEVVTTPASFLSSNLYFEAGEKFAIRLRRTELSNPGLPPWMLWKSINNVYSNGAFFLRTSAGWEERDGDHGFRSYVVPYRVGDANLDGSVSLLDVAVFVDILANGEFLPEVDINCDGAVDLLDVELFVAVLSG